MNDPQAQNNVAGSGSVAVKSSAMLVVARSWVLAAALFTVARAAAADEDQARTEALAKFQEGIELYRKSNLEGARVRFLEAYSVLHSADVLWNLSITELRSGRPLEALQHLHVYLRDGSVDSKSKGLAEPYLKEAYDRTGHIHLLCDAGKVAIDNAEARDCPVAEDFDVSPGSHTVHFPESGRRVDVVCDAGQVRVVNVSATARNEAHVAAATPSHPGDDAKWIVGGSLLGAGAVGIVSGIVFGVASRNSRNDGAAVFASKPGSCDVPALVDERCRQASDALDKANSQSTISLVSYITGGALLVAGASVVALWPSARAASARWKLQPTVGGAAIAGQF